MFAVLPQDVQEQWNHHKREYQRAQREYTERGTRGNKDKRQEIGKRERYHYQEMQKLQRDYHIGQ